ncbi:DUF4192 domain-containing protein [Amycolatopsis ultiminotia]|uniref:DUF4192 domain-containing protein n=1 Tax=Amycolatopsis ultiminotia TaxID=543629 RepID=A0ABP6YMM8_9PSEU
MIFIHDTGEFVATIPALLGFIPSNSLVLIATTPTSVGQVHVGPIIRCDLATVRIAGTSIVSTGLTRLADEPVHDISGFLIGADTSDESPLRDMADEVAELLRQSGFRIRHLIHVPELVAGARWQCYLTADCRGTLPDPATTITATASAAAGYTIAGSREEVAARYTKVSYDARERVRPLIRIAASAAQADLALSTATRERIGRTRAAIRCAADGTLPTDDAVIADLIATFSTIPFRDVLLSSTAVEQGFGTEHLALYLWRHCDEPYASHLAAINAVQAYLRGDTVVAMCALETGNPRVPIIKLLTSTIRLALPPSTLRELLDWTHQKTLTVLSGDTNTQEFPGN